jgi:poly(A) polymerase
VLADWWQEFSLADDNLRQDMVDQVREEQQQKQRAPRVHKVPVTRATASQIDVNNPAPEGETVGLPNELTDSSEAPKKRRRRRRATGGPREDGAGVTDAGA